MELQCPIIISNLDCIWDISVNTDHTVHKLPTDDIKMGKIVKISTSPRNSNKKRKV